MNKKLVNKVTLGVVVGALTITGIYNVFANSSENNSIFSNNSVKTEKGFRAKGNDEGMVSKDRSLKFKEFNGEDCFSAQFDFSTLVEEGVIDQATADQVAEYMKQKAEEMKAEFEKMKDMSEDEKKAYMDNFKSAEKIDLFDELIEKGILTQEQATVLKEKSKVNMGGFRGNGFGAPNLDASMLVEQLGLDQATADAISDYIAKKAEERKAEFEEIKNMTEDEKKAYMDSIKDTKKTNIIDELVEQGLLTQEQAAELNKKFEAGRENLKNGFMRTFDFSKLVNDGIITQETADKITAYLAEKGDKIKVDTENNDIKERVNIFDELVAAGIITQEQATSISENLKNSENLKKPMRIKNDFNTKSPAQSTEL